MSAYMIAQIEITDPDEYQNYLAGFMPIFQRYGGELLATSKNETVVIEGEWAYPRTVIMKFPSVEQARKWYEDPDYKSLAEHRHACRRNALGHRRDRIYGGRGGGDLGFDIGVAKRLLPDYPATSTHGDCHRRYVPADPSEDGLTQLCELRWRGNRGRSTLPAQRLSRK